MGRALGCFWLIFAKIACVPIQNIVLDLTLLANVKSSNQAFDPRSYISPQKNKIIIGPLDAPRPDGSFDVGVEGSPASNS